MTRRRPFPGYDAITRGGPVRRPHEEHHMTPPTTPPRRTRSIVARIPTPRRGRHAATPTRRQRWTTRSLTGVAAGIVVATATLTALTPDTEITAATTTAVIPASEAETIFVAELADAGITLTPAQALTAVDIARTHVAHGHLVGMREPIRRDLRDAFPHLDEEQVETAKMAIEHHFLAVTGRKQ